MTDPLRVHPFHWDWPRSTWLGEAVCDCGSIRQARVHELPERSEDEKSTESRKLGEGGDE